MHAAGTRGAPRARLTRLHEQWTGTRPGREPAHLMGWRCWSPPWRSWPPKTWMGWRTPPWPTRCSSSGGCSMAWKAAGSTPWTPWTLAAPPALKWEYRLPPRPAGSGPGCTWAPTRPAAASGPLGPLFRGPLASTAEHLSDSDPTRADEWVREPGGNHPFAARLRAAMALLPPVLGGAPTQPLEAGRTTRVVQAAQRTALAVRDGGCVFPGCGRPLAWCEAHHLRHWLHGGPTDLANLACLGLIIGRCMRGLATPATTRWAADRHPTVPNTSAPPTAPTTSRRGLRAPPA
jgi:hypothetical protein